MAASDEEGSQSDKNDDPLPQTTGKQFSTIHQEIESKLQKNSNYADQVEAVLSGWEHLAGTVRPDGTHIQELAFFLYKTSLRLVLYGEWTGLAQIVKTRLQVTLQKCSRVSTFQVGVLEPMCRTLLPLVNEPWGHPTLKAILGGIQDVSDEEVIKYVEAETWEVIRVRVDTMMESKKCEDLAMRVLKVCLRCIELKNETERPEIPLYTDEDHNHFMDLYFGLLYKEDQIIFVREVRELKAKGVQMVNRIVKKQEKLKVWKHRLKIGNLAAQVLLINACKNNDNPFFWQAFNEWCDIQQELKTPDDELQKMIHRFRQEIELSSHIYTLASILFQKFGECCRALVTELFIRGLTIDMNSREGILVKSEDKRPKELCELELQMACGYMDLAQVFGNNFCIVRECILTAFSLHPTLDRMQLLEKYSFVPVETFNDTTEQLRNTEVIKEQESKSYQCKETQNTYKDPSDHFEGFGNENNVDNPSVFLQSYDNSINSQGSVSAISTSPIRDMNLQSSQEMSQCTYPSNNISESTSAENNPSGNESQKIGECKMKNAEEKQVPQIYPELCENREPPPEPQEIVFDTGQSQPPGIGFNPTLESSVLPSMSSKQHPDNCEMTKHQPIVLDDDTKDSFNKITSDSKTDINKEETEDVEESHSMERFYMDTEKFIKQMKDDNLTSCQSGNVSDIMSNPNQVLNSEKLGLSKELCDDLAVVLSCPRWQSLTWKTPWDELTKICNAYLHDSDSAKNWAKELKYLDLDYSQFSHLPTAELHEFTGIERGYEQFIKYDNEYEVEDLQYSDSDIHQVGIESESTDTEKKDTIKKRFKGSRSYESDSDSSDDSDVQCIEFEGKRVTAVSFHDRSKRICIDTGTGKLKNENINELRRFRPTKPGLSKELPPKFVPKNNTFVPRLSSLNSRPNIALTKDKKPADQSQQPLGGRSSQYNHGSTWKYAGSLVAPPLSRPQQFNSGASNINTPRSTSVQCYYRAKDGKVHMAPIGKTFIDKIPPVKTNNGNQYVRQNPTTGEPVIYKTKSNASVPPVSKPSSFEDSYAKFLAQQSPPKQPKGILGERVTISQRKNMSLDDSLEYLKKQGTSVSFKSQQGGGSPLANAQKNVLNRILSPENTINAISNNRNRHTIAMPVSNNPPNNPGNLNRVLPKGTTVVRKPKQDGAGPSGVSNNVTVSSNIISSPRVGVPQRPIHFSGLVARPSVTLTSGGIRQNSFVARPTIVSSNIMGATYSHVSSESVINSINSGCPTRPNLTRPIRPGVAGVMVTPSLPAPLVAATVVGSVLSSGVNRQSTPVRTQQGGTSNGFEPQWELVSAGSTRLEPVVTSSTVTLQTSNISRVHTTTHTTTVATQPGDIRAASMLETLLRDRGPVTCSQPLHHQASHSTASTTITAALPQTLTSVVGLTGSGGTVTLSAGDPSQPCIGTVLNSGNSNSTSTNNSGVVVSSTPGSNAVIVSGGQVLGNPIFSTATTASSTGDSGSSSNSSSTQGAQQVLVPGQLVQVHTSDGSTGLGIVHSASVDLRLPAGTRVIKSNGSNAVRATMSQQPQQLQPQLTGTVITQPGGRQVNVLHNVKIVQNVQNRQIVRTVVVPHNMAIQGLSGQASQLKPHLVALSQGTSASPSGSADPIVSALQQQLQVSPSPHPQIVSSLGTVRSKIPASTLVQKMVGRNVVGGSLVIRTLRPGTSTATATIQASPVSSDTSTFEEGLGAKLQQQQSVEGEPHKDKGVGVAVAGNAVVNIGRLPQDEGLGERLSHYLKTALVNTSHTQSVGTQTLTTAVKPSAGQLVNQVALSHLRANAASSNTTINITGTTQTIVGQTSTKTSSSSNQQQRTNLVSMPMTPSNAVSSETLEQLREFESVFEKVSGNKSCKQESSSSERSQSTESSTEPFPNMTTISSEESMIAAQLLNMANDTSATVAPSTTSSNYVYSVPTTVFDASGTPRLSEGTYITIPSTTQAGTLILVNHSGTNAPGTSGLVTVASGGGTPHPPTAPSPTLSTTSSHSSIASSPSSTSSKGNNQLGPKSQVSPNPSTPSHTSIVSVPSPSSATTTVVVTTSPKSPQPPKPPTPKPVIAKPQVEESDETKARIQAILEQYKQDLANTPQPQPAPRNRKNCPPPKSDGKSSKKKSPAKKSEGERSPAVSEGSIAGASSPSPSPSSTSEGGGIGPIIAGNTTGVQTVQYSQMLPDQGLASGSDNSIPDIKPKIEPVTEVISGSQTTAPQLLQGVVVSNVKVEGGALGGNMAGLTGALGGGRVVQLIRHGGKVTAITTRHPVAKVKTGSQVGGAPPNVTIQGRISMNDLMESHIASLLTGGSTLQAPGPTTVVNKVVQQSPMGPHQAVQQVIVQTSGGQQVLQHVALQQIAASQPSKLLQDQLIKSQLQLQSQGQQCTTGGVIQLLTRAPITEDLLGLASTTRTLHVNAHSPNPISPPSIVSTTAVAAATPTVTAVVMPALPPSIQQSPQNIVLPSSPHTPQPPHTPSPAPPTNTNELPPTPLSFQMGGEESNSSDNSGGQDSLGGPLPPFFTLTKPFMVNQPSSQQPTAPPPSPGGSTSSKETNTTPSRVSPQHQQKFSESSPSDSSRLAAPSESLPKTPNKPPGKAEKHDPSPPSVIYSSRSGGGVKARMIKNANSKSSSGVASKGGSREGNGTSPQASSNRSSSFEISQSGGGGSSRTVSARLAHCPQGMRSNSLDSLASDISVEEVQIPPSPATLNKQLQSAYMTEAALSPSVSQSQHSNHSSSPFNAHELPLTETLQTSAEHRFSPRLNQPLNYSSAPIISVLQGSNIPSLEGENGLVGPLDSPSAADVYIHQQGSGGGLSLESLSDGSLPGLVVGGIEARVALVHSPVMEGGRGGLVHSPVLSDLVSSGPLLTWSPRSADSMMVQSPSLNDALLTANIPLDVNHSEDSLCDSSTGFPGLFSMEGDGVSVSSSTSEDLTYAAGSSGLHNQHQTSQIEMKIDLKLESEQDHTVSSTRADGRGGVSLPIVLELPALSAVGREKTLSSAATAAISCATASIASTSVDTLGGKETKCTSGEQDVPWRFDNTASSKTSSKVPFRQSRKRNDKHNVGKDFPKSQSGPPNKNLDPIFNEIKSQQKCEIQKQCDIPQECESLQQIIHVKKISRNQTFEELKHKEENFGRDSSKLSRGKNNLVSPSGSDTKGTNEIKCHIPNKNIKIKGQKQVSVEEKYNITIENKQQNETATRNGHDDEINVKNIKFVSKNNKEKTNRSQKTFSENLSRQVFKNRSKSGKVEIKEEKAKKICEIKKEVKEETAENVILNCGLKNNVMNLKNEMKANVKDNVDENKVRSTRGAKRKSESEIFVDLKKSKNLIKAGKQTDGEIVKQEENTNHLGEYSSANKSGRGRHISGASDSSSNYSLERVNTPGPNDSRLEHVSTPGPSDTRLECVTSPGNNDTRVERVNTPGPNDTPATQGNVRRRGCQSNRDDSSTSSRDGSPAITHVIHEPPGGVNTRRSSSRDHAKKKKCSCCVGGAEQRSKGSNQSASSGSGRRSGVRSGRPTSNQLQ